MPTLKNPRHERFAQELARGTSANEAYVTAGYRQNRGNSCTLKNDQNISKRVAEIMVERQQMHAQATAEAVQRAAVTIDSLIAEAEEARSLAMRLDQPSAAVSALTAKAKLAGMWIEKSERTNRYVDPDNLSDAEIVERLRTIGGSLATVLVETQDHPKVTH